MLQANRLAEKIGWLAAVERVVPQQAGLICDSSRADFQYLWDLPPDSSILSVGDDWGAIATALGANFSHVTAVEPALERARFIDIRARAAGAPVEVICADLLRLPLAPRQFDAVALNGCLEWSSLAARGVPIEIQLRLLRSVRDLLKPSGFACLSIGNLLGWGRTGGGRFGVGFTRSLSGYRKLFHKAGYGAVRSFHPWDGGDHPSCLLPLDHPGALAHYVEFKDFARSGWRGRIKRLALHAAARTGLWSQLAPEFIFLAENG
jgi:SAM-dependent methyltransferase